MDVIHSSDIAVIVRLDGEWDIARTSDLRSRLWHGIEATGCGGTLVLDIREVSFIDSAVLAVLLRAQDRLERRDAHMLTVSRRDTLPSRVMTLTGLDDVFGMRETD